MNRRYRKTIIAGNWKMNKTATEAKKGSAAQDQVVRRGRVRAERGHFRRRARL